MKKVFILLMTISLMFSLNSCEWFNKNKDNEKKEVIVENVVKADRDYMTANYANTYVWYETQISLNDYLDEDCDGSFSKIVDKQEFTIFEGDWGEYYAVRVEVWHCDASTKKETKLLEKIYRMEGWMR